MYILLQRRFLVSQSAPCGPLERSIKLGNFGFVTSFEQNGELAFKCSCQVNFFNVRLKLELVFLLSDSSEKFCHGRFFISEINVK